MNIRLLSFFLFALVFINSCSIKNPELIKKQEITYEPGFSARDPFGVFYNKEDKTEYFYIADMGQYRKLVFFTIDGKKAMEIPTDSLSDWRNTNGITIKNLDTIIFVMSGSPGRANDRIVFMDRNGKRWKKIELATAIKPDENNITYYFLKSEMNLNTFFDGNSLFLSAAPVDETIGREMLKSKNNDLMLRTIIPIVHKSHSLLKYNINTNQYQLALSTMWRIICPDTNLYFARMYFAVENNTLFIYSVTGNEIYLLDKETFEIKKKVEIQSPYTEIGILPVTMEERVAPYYELSDSNGRLINIIYDKYNNFYYVIFRHGAEDPLFWDESSFSIQIYDEKFNKLLAEQVFDGKEYNPKFCLVCSQGLLIRHSSTKRDYNPLKIKFDLFTMKNK